MASWVLCCWLTALPVSGDVPVRSAAVFCSDGQIAFVGGAVGQEAWYRVGRDGGSPEPLYLDPPYDRAEAGWWSPDGSRIAYLATVGGRLTLQVWEVGAVSSQPFSVLDESGAAGGFEPQVAWSRDGQRLAFTRRAAPESDYPYAIFVLGADGTGPLRDVLSPYPPLALAWDWTAEKLAHAADVGQRRVLFVTFMDPARAVTVSPNLTVLPRTLSFSPDGRRVLFGGTGDPRSGARLFVSRPDGMIPAERMRHDGYLPDRAMAWSPDGRWLAFCTGSLSRPDRGRLQLVAATALDRPQPAARDLAWVSDPVFSPDSRWLAITSHQGSVGEASEVALVAVDSPSRSLPLTGPRDAAQPVFAPDSTQLAVVAGAGNARALYLLLVPPRPAPG